MLALLTLFAFAAEPTRIAVFEPSLAGLDDKTGHVYFDYFTQQISAHTGLRVVRQEDIAAVLGLERQKELLGCESSACTSELAGAFGVDAIVRTSLAKLGGGYVVGITVLQARDASTLATWSGRPTDENALLELLAQTADELAAKLTGTEPAAPPSAVASGAAPRGWVAAAVASVGLLGAGGAFLGVAAGQHAALAAGQNDYSNYAQLADARVTGQNLNAAGVSMLAAGAVGAALAATLLLAPVTARRWWYSGVAGLAAIIVGAVLLGLAASDGAAVASANTAAQVEDRRGAGEMKHTGGLVLIACGAGGILSSGAALLVGLLK